MINQYHANKYQTLKTQILRIYIFPVAVFLKDESHVLANFVILIYINQIF